MVEDRSNKHICTFCSEEAIEHKLHFLSGCLNCQKIRKDTFNSITNTSNLNLNNGNKIKNLKQLFSVGFLRSLNSFDKFFYSAMKTN